MAAKKQKNKYTNLIIKDIHVENSEEIIKLLYSMKINNERVIYYTDVVTVDDFDFNESVMITGFIMPDDTKDFVEWWKIRGQYIYKDYVNKILNIKPDNLKLRYICQDKKDSLNFPKKEEEEFKVDSIEQIEKMFEDAEANHQPTFDEIFERKLKEKNKNIIENV
jgi:hypothetical protein